MNNLQMTKKYIKKIEKEVYKKFPWTDFKIRFLEDIDYRLEVYFYYKGKKAKLFFDVNNDMLIQFEGAEDFARAYVRYLEIEINRLINSKNERN